MFRIPPEMAASGYFQTFLLDRHYDRYQTVSRPSENGCPLKGGFVMVIVEPRDSDQHRQRRDDFEELAEKVLLHGGAYFRSMGGWDDAGVNAGRALLG